jgi:hypothetical protein
MSTTVVGLFDDRDTAQHAVRDLIDAGFRQQDISVVAADPGGKMYRQHVDEEGSIAGEGAATGLTSGAVVGGLLGLLIGAGLLFVPAGVIAAGPITGLIAGGAAGAATGGIIGGLIGLGIPKEDADVYAESVRRGGTLVTVMADDANVSRIHSILDRDGAVDVEERAAQYRAQGFSGFDTNAPVYSEEETLAERERYRATPASPAVGTTNEAVTPPPVPAAASADQDFALGNRTGSRVRTYTGQGWSTDQAAGDDTYYRDHFQSTYGASGAPFDSYRPAYEYGQRVANDPRFANRNYADVESDLRYDYDRQYPGQYDQHRNAIQVAFDRAKAAVGLGGHAYADNPNDTRGTGEKIADAITGDRIDDNTGRRVD